MGWLFQQIGDFFCKDDGSYPEICVCCLPGSRVKEIYGFIRKNCQFTVGKPRFFNREQDCEMELNDVDCAATLVTEGKAQPFHFMVRNVRFGKDSFIPEVGVFIMHNAVALDYEKGPIWGELEIESLLLLVLKGMNEIADSFIRLEDSVAENDKNRFRDSLERLGKEATDLSLT